LYGDLSRLAHTDHPADLAYLLLALAALGLATLAARRQLRAGRSPQALCCIAIGGLLVSPISWTHHWVWLLPVALVLAVDGRRVSLVLLIVTAVVAPMWFTPLSGDQSFRDVWWQAALCLSYTVVGAAFLVTMLAGTPPGNRAFGRTIPPWTVAQLRQTYPRHRVVTGD
jgi:alpha-1,2-mannosyltransferase